MSSCACVATLVFLLLLRWFLGLRPIYLCVVFPPFSVVDLWSTTLQEAKKFTRSKFRWVDFELWTNLSCRCSSAAVWSGSATGEFDFGLTWIFIGLFTPLLAYQISYKWYQSRLPRVHFTVWGMEPEGRSDVVKPINVEPEDVGCMISIAVSLAPLQRATPRSRS